MKLYKDCKILFSDWDDEYEKIKKEISVIIKLRNEKSLITYPKGFEHDNLKKRLKELKKFRVEHQNLIEITTSLNGGNETENNNNLIKEIQNAYDKMSEINILDLSKNGEINWVNAKNEYFKVTEKIESQISNSLSDQLASAETVNDKFKIFNKFSKLMKRPRVQNAIQEYQT
jgi:dynein heavy chain 1